jgi:glycosyltransferase involved in cell wall biosynthesis
MRILIAIPYYAPAYAFGGSVTVAETIAEGLAAAGHAVTVLTTDVLDERSRTAESGLRGRVRVERFPNVSHRAAAAANVYLPRGLRRRLAGAGEFDVALLLDLYSAVSVLAARAGIPYALQPLGTAGAGSERGRPLAKRAFLSLWGRRTLRGAAAVVHSTAHERAELLAVGAPADRLVELPLPLELPEAGAGERAGLPTVVSIGRLHPIKRIDRLVEAVAIAREDVPGLRLEIAGPGERVQAQLQRLARDLGVHEAVAFHGFVPDAERVRLLSQAHCFALLSAGEGLPMAVLEALACGTPAVVSEGCHLPEIDGVAGIETDGSAEAAAAAIVRLLGDEALHGRLAAGARDFAAAFRADAVLPRLEAELQRIARRTPAQ